MQSLSGYSVYDGWQVQGWPRFVVRRGQPVLADGQITARPGDGEWLRRNRTAGMLPSARVGVLAWRVQRHNHTMPDLAAAPTIRQTAGLRR
jgi:hypothetical protein